MSTQSLWTATSVKNSRQTLKNDIEVDVAIVGAGITGLSAALLLKDAGKSVAVLEKREVGSGETGQTTAHLSELIDTRYYQLIRDFGKEGARQVFESGRIAINHIERTAKRLQIHCDFKRVHGYLFAETHSEAQELQKELSAALDAGLVARLIDKVPAPIGAKCALMVQDQAQIHALRYLEGLAQSLQAEVYENTPVTEFHSGNPCRLTTPSGSVTAKDVIFATNHPISTRFLMHTKLAAYRTYALSAPIDEKFPDGLFWDLQDPYHYIRAQVVDGRKYLIIGGEDRKTGQDRDTHERLNALKVYAREKFGVSGFTQQWSGQVIEPVDGLPYIGQSPFQDHFYIATGYSGNGMTWGVAAALLLTDLVQGRAHPWAKLYEPSRITPKASAWDFVAENKDVPMCLAKDYLCPAEAESVSEIAPGEGKIVKQAGGKVAVYRDESGNCHGLSPVCPHMGCHVRWNGAEKTWDCPCHGSRFSTAGDVLNGPSITGLKKVSTAADHAVASTVQTHKVKKLGDVVEHV